MKIRQASLATSLSLALVVICFMLYELASLQKERRREMNTGLIVQAGSLLSQATIELSLERSVMQVALNLPDPITPRFKSVIQTQRWVYEKNFTEIEDLLGTIELDSDVAQRVSAALAKSHRTITSIREKADRLSSLSSGMREARAVDELPGQLKQAILDLARVPIMLRNDEVHISSRLQTLLDIQTEAWAVREFGGRERTYLAIATASGEPFSQRERLDMVKNHALAKASMVRLKALSQFAGLNLELIDKIDSLEDVYFKTYDATRQLILGHDLAKGAYPIGFNDFFAASSKALDVAVDLSAQAGQLTVDSIAENSSAIFGRFLAIVGVLIFVLLLCGLQLYYSQVQLSGRLIALSVRMRHLAEGDNSVSIEGQHRRDEIGDMARAVQIFKANALARIEVEKQAAVERERERERLSGIKELLGRFSDALLRSTGQVKDQSGSLLATSKRLGTVAHHAAEETSIANQATGTAESNVQAVAAASEQLSASISEIANQAETAQNRTYQAAERVQSSHIQVSSLELSVTKIGSIINLINDIADQTNLLALNATIEAARAGEAGHGFAVVANEVKALASQTASATGDIINQISEIQGATSQTVAAISDVTSAVSDIRDLVGTIATAVDSQKAATDEIAQSVSAASLDASTVLTSIHSVSGSINKTTDEANLVRDAADMLSATTEEMADRVDEFVQDVSADVGQRRKALRVALSHVAVINHNGQRENAQFVDLSETGARLTKVRHMAVGQSVKLQLSDCQQVSAKVVRHTEDGLAVAFDAPVKNVHDLVLSAA